MARQSAEALSIARGGIGEAPPPPDDLQEAEAVLWREITDSKPSDWFGPDSIPVFKEYVRAAVACDLLASRVNAALLAGDKESMKFYMDIRDKESRRSVSLATKLRLTQQSRYGARSADRADGNASGPKPWQKTA